KAKPFEIAVMIARDHDRTFRSVTLGLFEVFQLDILRKIFGRQTRTPQEIEHSPRELLKRFPRDLFAIALRELIPKCDFEIAESDFSAVPIHHRHQRTDRQRESITGLP